MMHFFQHGSYVVLAVVVFHLIELGLGVEFIDKEAVESWGRGDHERIDALEFGVEFEGAFNGLAFVGLTLVEDYAHEDVVFGYLGVLCRLVEIRHPHGVAAVTAVVLCRIAVRWENPELCGRGLQCFAIGHDSGRWNGVCALFFRHGR